MGWQLQTLTWLGFPLLMTLLLGTPYLQWLKQKMFGQFIREDGPQSHQQKAGTPTAGGLLFLIIWALGSVMSLLFASQEFPQSIPFTGLGVLFTTLGLGYLGFRDDFAKIMKKHNKGLTGWAKLATQSAIGFGLGFLLMVQNASGQVVIPFGPTLTLGWLYPVYTALSVVAVSNAVNLTDGLDGLASSTSMITLVGLTLALGFAPALLATESHLLQAMAVIMLGALLGFFHFNRYPAQVFMGDTGSLALGGLIVSLALSAQLEWWLFLMGIIFVLETLSVMLQVFSYKLFKRRIFKMAPLHHHFELCGWHEQQVVLFFGVIQALATGVALWIQTQQ
jgi:phospho-N-acetylmuramoyl-pentapeptide-transferase